MKILLAVDGSEYTKKMLAYLTTHDSLFSADHSYTIFTAQPQLPPRARAAVGKEIVDKYHTEEAEKIVAPVSKFLARHGIEVLDAPMSGGPARARDGSMSLMLAGPDELVARFEALLAALSSRIFRISARVGDGARTKLVNNLAAGINLVGAAEVLAMARAMGLDLGCTLDVIEQSSGQSWIGSDRMRRAIIGDVAPRAHMTLLEKDTRLAVQAAQAAGFSGPLGAAAARVFARASAAGLADLDDAALLRWLEDQT